MGPLVSVIVPVYKVEKYLHRCVDSILNQTYSNLEIFLVDDGSPDSCGVICDEYAKKDPRIVVIHKKNGGLADARNVAIHQAKGDFITCIDSDDFVTKDNIETLLNLCIKYDADISICGHHYYSTEKDLEIPESPIKEIAFDSVSALKHMLYQREFDTAAWAKIYHRRLFKEIEYSTKYITEDLATTYKLMSKADKVAYTNKKTYYYFLREDSITGAPNPRKMDCIELFDEMTTYLRTVQPSLLIPAYNRMVSYYFNLSFQMKGGDPNTFVLWDKIKKYRSFVLKDKEGRLKAKLACIISFLGINTVRRLYTFIDSETKKRNIFRQ